MHNSQLLCQSFFINNLEIIVDFLVTMYTVDEDVGVATVTLTKTGDNEIPVTVSVVTMTADDTAIGCIQLHFMHILCTGFVSSQLGCLGSSVGRALV